MQGEMLGKGIIVALSVGAVHLGLISFLILFQEIPFIGLIKAKGGT